MSVDLAFFSQAGAVGLNESIIVSGKGAAEARRRGKGRERGASLRVSYPYRALAAGPALF